MFNFKRNSAVCSVYFCLLIQAGAIGASESEEADVDRGGAAQLVFTQRADFDPQAMIDVPMIRSVAGILAIREGRAAREFLASLGPPKEPLGFDDRTPMCYLHVEKAISSVSYLVFSGDDERLFLREITGPESRPVFAIDRHLFEECLQEAPSYRGSFEPILSTFEVQNDLVLARPYDESPLQFDAGVMEERLFRGGSFPRMNTTVDLSREEFHVRLPRDYDPRSPAGLLVWCSPVSQGRIPWMFEMALDELGFIGVGVENAGNMRLFSERAQLMLDVIETAQRRFHIDPRRIYMTGMSGGGRVTSAFSLCFPDVIRGSVPIVGFSSYNNTTFCPAMFNKPQSELLALASDLPIAMMSGPPDFNYREMSDRKRRLEMDGFTGIRMFEYPDMSHSMPKPERFLDAMQYVDERYVRVRQAQIVAAQRLLDTLVEEAEGGQVNDESLIEVIRTGPWTDAAWKALELLQQSWSDQELIGVMQIDSGLEVSS